MILTKDTIELYAARFYNNTLCASKEEFDEDFERFSLVQRIARKHVRKGSINIRLLINHIIALSNMFTTPAAKKILMFVCNNNEKEVVKACLLYLGHMEKHEYSETRVNLDIIKLIREGINNYGQ